LERRRCALSEPSAAEPRTPLGQKSESASWRRLSNMRIPKRHAQEWLASHCRAFAIPNDRFL
jgi:hypothetical protein